MYYIQHNPDKNGNYGNPRGEEFEGALKLPDKLLDDYINAKGFVYFEVINGIITSININEQAYNIYINSIPEAKEDPQERINRLKNNLARTDYIACKIAEGSATREEYADIIAQRQAWRDEINELEKEVL